MSKKTISVLQMLLCAAFWSIAGIFIKLIPWNGFAIAGARSLIAGTTIAVYMCIKRIKLNINKKTLLSGAFTACVYTCFVCSNKLTTAANAIVLQFTSPAFIVLFTFLMFGKKPRRADILVITFTMIGIAMFFLDKLEAGYILGNFVAVAAGMFMAGMFITVGNLNAESRFSAILTGQFFTFLIGLPALLTTRPELSEVAVASVFVLGVIQLGISYILYIKSTEFCPPLACCLLGAVEPLLNPVWVLIFDGERPGLYALIGSIVVIVTITLWCINDARNGENNESENTGAA